MRPFCIYMYAIYMVVYVYVFVCIKHYEFCASVSNSFGLISTLSLVRVKVSLSLHKEIPQTIYKNPSLLPTCNLCPQKDGLIIELLWCI